MSVWYICLENKKFYSICSCSVWCLDGVFHDPPFGIGKEPWDKRQFSQEEYMQIFKQLAAVNNVTPYVYFGYTPMNNSSVMYQAMADSNFGGIIPMIVYKVDANNTGNQCYTYATDMIMTGGYKDSESVMISDRNPGMRHNFIAGRKLPMHAHHADTNEIVNWYEKAPWVAARLAEERVRPGGKVLVLGAGAGGEVLGLISSGYNVVAIEQNQRQIEYLNSRLMALKVFKEEKKMEWEHLIPTIRDGTHCVEPKYPKKSELPDTVPLLPGPSDTEQSSSSSTATAVDPRPTVLGQDPMDMQDEPVLTTK